MAAQGLKEGIKDKCNIDTNRDIEFSRTKDKDIVEYEDLLSAAGEFGKYQVILFLSTFPFYIFAVFNYYSQLLMTESSNHWCWIPELASLNETERLQLAIPLDAKTKNGYSHCYSYDANWTELLTTGQRPDHTWNTIPCQNGWETDKSEIPYPTITSEMGWFCEKNSYQATAQALFFVGSGIGGLIIGWIADRFGRLPAAVTANLIGCVGGIASVYARDFIQFAICRFFTGMAYDNCMMMAYLIVLEYVVPKYRTLLSNLSFALFYSVAVTAIPWIALACGHWKTFGLVTSVPLALAIFAFFIIPESPRWLLSMGRVEETIEKIRTIGRINKREVPPKLIEQFKTTLASSKEENKGSLLDLMRRPALRRLFIYICMLYLFCTMVFDGLVRSIGQLDFDYFVSFSVISFTEFPSMLIVAFVMDWLGRRWLVVISMTVSCIFIMLTVFVGSGFVSVLFAIVARFSVNMAYSAAMQWAAEVMPVAVRGSAASIVHICGYIATIITPYIIYLETFIFWLPLVIIGCVAGISLIFALLLPETANKDMPQTFEEAEHLMTSQKFWDMPFLKKKNDDLNKEIQLGHINDSYVN